MAANTDPPPFWKSTEEFQVRDDEEIAVVAIQSEHRHTEDNFIEMSYVRFDSP